MYHSNQNQEVIQLILRLRTLEQEYPNRMLSARRAAFHILLSQYHNSYIRVRRQAPSTYGVNKIPNKIPS